jgi:hypothetical protein
VRKGLDPEQLLSFFENACGKPSGRTARWAINMAITPSDP